MMLKISMMIGAVLLAASSMSAFAAAESCDDGYKSFMKKSSIYYGTLSAADLSDAVHRSFDAYNECKAGDGFSLHGVWDQILADMEKKAKK